LGDRHSDDNADQAGLAIEAAVTSLLAERTIRTADLGGTSSTVDVAEAIVQRLGAFKALPQSLNMTQDPPLLNALSD
jgi:3-isopropylmalate dehydrogenase